jgi:hypothetical protein
MHQEKEYFEEDACKLYPSDRRRRRERSAPSTRWSRGPRCVPRDRAGLEKLKARPLTYPTEMSRRTMTGASSYS